MKTVLTILGAIWVLGLAFGLVSGAAHLGYMMAFLTIVLALALGGAAAFGCAARLAVGGTNRRAK